MIQAFSTLPKKAYLVDGSGYIFRAFYAISSLRTKEGFPTNALYGFTRMLLRLLKEADSEHVVVVFDAGRVTFRNELYKDYKANRDEAPDDLVKQFPFFREIARALGFIVFEQPGYEADDIIATLTEKLSKDSIECVVVSGDKDLMQLVGGPVSVWDTMKDVRYSAKEVKEKLGVEPDKVVDLLGLMGDSSDNVPGMAGVGPKTAVQLIQKYGGIEEILAAGPKIAQDPEIRNRKRIAELIESEAEQVRLSRLLVEIKRDVPLVLGTGAPCVEPGASGDKEGGESTVQLQGLSGDEIFALLGRCEPDKSKLNELIEKFEFGSLVKDFKIDLRQEPVMPAADSRFKIIGAEDFPDWIARIKQQSKFSFDLETTSLDVFEARIVGASFCWSEDEAFYLPLAHQPEVAAVKQVSLDDFIRQVGPLLSDEKIKKIGQNLKYDMQVLDRHGLELRGIQFDSMVAAYLLNPDRRSYNLTALSQDYLQRPVIEYDTVAGGLPDFSYVPLDKAAQYACQDAHLAWCLMEKLSVAVHENDLDKVFAEIEIPLIEVLARMELKGIKLDSRLLGDLSKRFSEELERLQGELYKTAGCEFNLNSPKQLSDILFNKLAIPTKGLKKTKTGVSTDSSVLEKLAPLHPLPGLILQYRSLHKLKSTYIDVLPAQVNPHTGRLHTKFNQTQAATGRLSSSDPNLQNIPIQTAEGRQIRQAFITEPGKTLISADYSQVELRILAHLSGDENLIQAFADEIDIHAKTAREIMRLKPDEQITSEVRRVGKTINFGVIYGMSGFRLGRELGIPVSVANDYIEKYFANYPKVQILFDRLEQDAATKGYVTTLFGRRRVIGDIDLSGRDQGFAMRAAVNAPLQGTAADLVKMAMIRIDGVIREKRLPLTMLLQIHDELLFECEESFRDEAGAMIRGEMENVAKLKVPLKVDVGCGRNWQEAQH